MIKVQETDDCVVYDEVLSQEQFRAVWIAVQQEKFVIPHIGSWSKVWRLSDGNCMGGIEYDSSNAPYNNYMDFIYKMFSEIAKKHPSVVPEWLKISMRSYLYPRGTKLSWHNDTGYLGAGIYYIHPEWASTWGGELLLAKTPPCNTIPPPHLDHREEDTFLSYYGSGNYITCKPNRLVLTKAGLWHSINRVDADAGDHVRASLVAFFKGTQ